MAVRWASLLFCFAVLSSHGQTATPVTTDIAPPPSSRFPASWYPADNNASYATAPETDSPYTATLVTTFRFIDPATGELKAISRTTLQARDGAGRKRDEEEMQRDDGHGAIVLAREVSVNDPVAHCSFRWMEPWVAPGKPTASVACLSRTLHFQHQDVFAAMIVTQPTVERSFDRVDRAEPLGKQMFGDIEAVGVRRTRTQTDATTGKVQQLVTEIWYSRDLKEMLEMNSIPSQDAGPGQAPIPDFELRDVHRAEPNPALFYPPNGYQIDPGH